MTSLTRVNGDGYEGGHFDFYQQPAVLSLRGTFDVPSAHKRRKATLAVAFSVAYVFQFYLFLSIFGL